MKKFTTAALCLLSVLGASAQSKFDATSRVVIEGYKSRQALPAATHVGFDQITSLDESSLGRADSRASVIIMLNEGYGADDLAARGFEITADLGDMVLANAELSEIVALEDCDAVKHVSFGEKRHTFNDRARNNTGVTDLHAGTGLSKGFDGTGVLAGIFDTGLDPNHVNFLDADFQPRVKALWHFRSSGGSAVSYLTPEKIKGFQTDDKTETHGTHTCGIMAGSYKKSGGKVAIPKPSNPGVVSVSARNANPYYGMATGADIAIGCGDLYDVNILNGLQKLIDYAAEKGQPAVVNLSIGSNVGPHDGSDATSQALDRFGKKAIICIAAGNEGDIDMSITKKFATGDTEFKTLWIDPYKASGLTSLASVYSNNSTPFDLTFMIVDKNTGATIYEYNLLGGKDQDVYITSPNYTVPSYLHDANFDKAFGTGSAVILSSSKNSTTNNRYGVNLQCQVSYSNTTNANRNYVIGLKVKGSAGQQIHMATNNGTFVKNNLNGYTQGDPTFSISSMCCGENIISVGAWNTRNMIPVVGMAYLTYNDTTGMEVGRIASYSSFGQLHDGRKLPLVCAPGTGVISSISKYYFETVQAQQPSYDKYMSAIQTANSRDNHWEAQQGTSMATPVVSGAIALMLQHDPTLTVDKIKDAIVKTAVRDQAVTSHKYPIQWGAGKFNAYRALQEIINPGGVNDVMAEGTDRYIITPAGQGAWDVYAPYGPGVRAELYNLSGVKVAEATTADDTVTISADGVQKGVYVLCVNGEQAMRVALK